MGRHWSYIHYERITIILGLLSFIPLGFLRSITSLVTQIFVSFGYPLSDGLMVESIVGFVFLAMPIVFGYLIILVGSISLLKQKTQLDIYVILVGICVTLSGFAIFHTAYLLPYPYGLKRIF